MTRSNICPSLLQVHVNENPSIHTADIMETKCKNGIFCISGYAVTLIFDLLNPNLIHSSFIQRFTSDKYLVKSIQCTLEISQKTALWTEADR